MTHYTDVLCSEVCSLAFTSHCCEMPMMLCVCVCTDENCTLLFEQMFSTDVIHLIYRMDMPLWYHSRNWLLNAIKYVCVSVRAYEFVSVGVCVRVYLSKVNGCFWKRIEKSSYVHVFVSAGPILGLFSLSLSSLFSKRQNTLELFVIVDESGKRARRKMGKKCRKKESIAHANSCTRNKTYTHTTHSCCIYNLVSAAHSFFFFVRA